MTETFTFEIESDTKNKMEAICRELGMSVASAFAMLAKRFTNDPFYSKSNIEYLTKVTSDIDAGKAKLEEHELVEV